MTKSDARTRAHSQSFRETESACLLISHAVLLECDASSHRFFFALFPFTQLTLHLIRRAFPGSERATSAQRQ
jgi:hypothetical protein